MNRWRPPSPEMEEQLFKRVQFEGGPTPNKYRELAGVAISAVTKCRECPFSYSRKRTETNGELLQHYGNTKTG